jgi:hypothetical protein
MTPEQKSILLKLENKTMQGKAAWKETAVDNKFVLDLEKYSISMLLSKQEGTPGLLYFEIINPQGKKIESFSARQEDLEGDSISSFIKLVRRKVLKVDEALKEVLHELDTKDVVGEDGLSKRRHLPF